MAVFKLDNKIQDYAWGSKTAIPELLGYENKDGRPMAELWMGAHPKAPSILVSAMGEKESLDRFISGSPEEVLGTAVAADYGGRLPYLFKVLAAGSPLSIQAHPNLEQAKAGYERENKSGIAPDAFNRSYKDDNHKPEIICALSEFHAMRGFKCAGRIASGFRRILIPELEAAVSALEAVSAAAGGGSAESAAGAGRGALKNFFTVLMTLEKPSADRLIGNALESAGQFEEGGWIKLFAELYPGDIGILSPLYLNVVTLKPGEAMYLPAGELHAYLQGTGMELMANSDNVLRGGLTPKYVDVPELMSTLTFESGAPEILSPRAINSSELVYDTEASEFCLSRIDLSGTYMPGRHDTDPGLPSLFICVEGQASIADDSDADGTALEARRGDTFFAAFGSRPVLKGEGLFYRASVPPALKSGGTEQS